MREERKGSGRFRPIADTLGELLKERGLEDDVARVAVLEAWARIVGPQIAAVTQPRAITADGTLIVGVKSNGWMTELSLMERQLLAKLNAAAEKAEVKKLRWELLR